MDTTSQSSAYQNALASAIKASDAFRSSPTDETWEMFEQAWRTVETFEHARESYLKITLVKSTIGRPRKQKANIKALGLSKLNHSVIKANKPFIRGMIFKVKHLVDVAEIMLPMGQEYP